MRIRLITVLLCVISVPLWAAEELSPWMILREDGVGSHFGWSVCAGDFDGDGVRDITVGAPFDSAAGYRSGAVYIFFGPDFASPPMIIPGLHPRDQMGISCDNAGDFNGDGYDDLLVGANVVEDIGAAYIFFGGPDLDSLPDVIFFGENPVDNFGYSCAGLGDLNGDGYDDVAVGALYNDELGDRTGKVYIYFGGDTPDSIPDIVLVGLSEDDDFGVDLDGRFDFDGDGVPDLLVGAVQAGDPFTQPGEAYVFAGAMLNLGASVPEFRFHGEDVFNFFGGTVAALGDFNGDGKDDVIVGAYNYDDPADPSDTSVGRAYIYFGRESTSAPWEIPDLIFTGRRNRDYFGGTVGAVGDINGDGFADAAVAASWDSITDTNSGVVFVFCGGFDPDDVPDYFCRPVPPGTEEDFGWTIEPLGDVTGDGYPDFAVANGVYSDTGKVYIFAGFATVSPVEAELVYPFDGAVSSDSRQATAFALFSDRVIDTASAVITLNGDTVSGGMEWHGDTVVFIPPADFADGESVVVCLEDVRTAAGDSLAGRVCTHFLVDLTPPVAVMMVPRDGDRVAWDRKVCAWVVMDSVSGRVDEGAFATADGDPVPVDVRAFDSVWVFAVEGDEASAVSPGEAYRICLAVCDSPDYGAPNCDTICVSAVVWRQWLAHIFAWTTGKDTVILSVGQSPAATEDFDPALDILMPPPAGTDVRLKCGEIYLSRDMRGSFSDSVEWQVVSFEDSPVFVRVDGAGFPMAVALWNDTLALRPNFVDTIPPRGSARLKVLFRPPRVYNLRIPFRWALSGIPGFPAYDNSGWFAELGAVGPLIYDRGFSVPERWLPGAGFFTFGTRPAVLPVWYYPAERIGVRAGRGWNLVTPPADGVAVLSVPEGMFIPPAYLFDGTAYYPADSLQRGVGYWVYFLGNGVCVLMR